MDIAAASMESCDAAMYDGPEKLALGRGNKWQGEHRVSITSMGIHQEVDAKWTNSEKRTPCKFDEDISDFITTHLLDLGWEQDYTYRAYTEMVFWVAGQHEQFRFCKSYKGKEWHDMCLINYWNEEKDRCERRAARLLTLVIFDTKVNVVRPIPYVMVYLSERVVSAKRLEQKFVLPIKMSRRLEILPVTSIASPLVVVSNNGGNKNEIFAILLRRKWARYFSKQMETYNSK